MDTVITLIAQKTLPPALVGRICQILSPDRPLHTVWLRDGIACDIFMSVRNINHLRLVVLDCVENLPIDCIVQLSSGRQKKLLLADMDSTIVTSETLDELASYAGVGDYVAKITARAMNGEIDFETALKERVLLLRDLPEEALEAVWQNTVLTEGARTLVQTMKKHGQQCVLISGGFSYFTQRVADACGFDLNISNELDIVNGCLTGSVLPPIIDKDAKLQNLQSLSASMKIDLGETVTVGDGANDIPMLKASGLGVAYYGKQIVRNEIVHQLNYTDLTSLLYAQGYFYREFAG